MIYQAEAYIKIKSECVDAEVRVSDFVVLVLHVVPTYANWFLHQAQALVKAAAVEEACFSCILLYALQLLRKFVDLI